LAKLVQGTFKGDPGGVVFHFVTSTADADPGAGGVAFNNATLANVTEVFVDNAEAGGNPIASWIVSFGSAPSTNKGVLIFQDVVPGTFAIFMVTGPVVTASGYNKVPVSYISGTAAPAAGDRLTTIFAPAGTKGDSLLNGSGVPASSLGSNGDVYLDISSGNFYGPKTAGSWGSPLIPTGVDTLVSAAAGS